MQRRLSAILMSDVVGYSRLMGSNEVGTLAALQEIRAEVIQDAVKSEGGRIVKLMGDGILAEFGSVVGALKSALEIQDLMQKRNAFIPEDRQIRFRMGINVGDVMVSGDDIFGDGVNIAARIEPLAQPGGIAVTAVVRDQVGNRLNVEFVPGGERQLKNIEGVHTLYHVLLRGAGEKPTPAEGLAGQPSIAVLPFANMSGDPEQEYFADGITEDLITDLAKLPGLFVVGRNSAFVYKGKAANLQQIARELGVRHILEGSVRKSGQRVRITGQLIDGVTGGHLWAERYDRDLSDIFAVQDEITKTIISQLQVKLLDGVADNRTPTSSVEAYNLFLKGRQLFHMRTRQNIENARDCFLQALRLDPNYARAYVGMADCESRLNDWFGGQYPVEDILGLAQRALEIEPEMAEAHAALGLALQIAGRDDEARKAYEASLARDPLCYEAHHYFGRFLRVAGDLEKSAYHFVRALEILPDDYRSPFLLVELLKKLGRHADSEKYLALGLKRAEEAVERIPDHLDPLQLGAAVLAACGEHDLARTWLKRTIDEDPYYTKSSGYNIACTYAQIGETDLALEWLERIFGDLGLSQRKWAQIDPDLDSLRDNPRFIKLLEKPRGQIEAEE